MALVRYNVAWTGFFTSYGSSTGLVDPRTGATELGGGLNLGDFCDLTEDEAQSISAILHSGRYRYCKVSGAAVAANTFQGAPAGIAIGSSIQQLAVLTQGSGQTPGTYFATISGGGGQGAVIQINVVTATSVNAQVISGGYGYTSTPTVTLTGAGGTAATFAAQMLINMDIITSFDSSAISVVQPRGLLLFALTAAQITAGAYVFMQEGGIGTALVSTATTTTIGSNAIAGTGGTITTAAGGTFASSILGQTLDVSAAGSLIRVMLDLPNFPAGTN